MKIIIDVNSSEPIYKQIVEFVIGQIRNGNAVAGDLLPSMNELAKEYYISRETVKKAYVVLRDHNYIEPHQGKGFYICNPEESNKHRILIIFDKLSTYKQVCFNNMVNMLGDSYEVVLRLHNQSVELLKFYLDESLDKYDYYVISPHFCLDDDTQKKAITQMKRVPYRKLIMLDHWIKDLPGNYGAVYQDFDHDIYDGLSQGIEDLRKESEITVVTFPSSLYHRNITDSVRRFCRDNDIKAIFCTGICERIVEKGKVFLLLNSQFDSNLLDLVHIANDKGLRIGQDYKIIYYNEYPTAELVLGGLTTVSTDFSKMGQLVAEMIIKRDMSKIKCPFRMIRRNTF